MQFRDAPVVAVKKGQEIFRQVTLVNRIKRAHDAEINGHVTTIGADKQIAGVHVGMEKIVPEYLGEKYFHAAFGQYLQVDVIGTQGIDITDLYSIDALHHHHVRAAIRPVHLRHVQYVGVAEIAP